MPKISISNLSAILNELESNKKYLAFLCFVITFILYLISWNILANNAKKQVGNFLTNQGISYQSIAKSGFPFSFKVTIEKPAKKLNLSHSIETATNQTKLAILFEKFPELFKFQWSQNISLDGTITLKLKSFSSAYDISLNGSFFNEKEINQKSFKTITKFDKFNLYIDFESGLFANILTPLTSQEEFLERIEQVKLSIENLREIEPENKELIYSVKKLDFSNNISQTAKDNNLYFNIDHQLDYAGSKYSKLSDKYLNEIYQIPLISFTLAKLELYNPFNFLDRFASQKGEENAHIEFSSEFNLNHLPNIAFKFQQFNKENNLTNYKSSGRFSYTKGEEKHIIRVDNDIYASPTKEWQIYIDQIQEAEKNDQIRTQKILQEAFPNNKQAALNKLYFLFYKFSPLNTNRNLKGFIYKLYNEQQAKLGAHANIELSKENLLVDIQNSYINANDFVLEFKGKANKKQNGNFLGKFELAILDYKILAKKIFALLKKDPANTNDEQKEETDNSYLVIANFLQEISSPKHSAKNNLVILLENQANFSEMQISGQNKTRILNNLKNILTPIFAGTNDIEKLLAQQQGTIAGKKLEEALKYRKICHNAGAKNNLNLIKSACKNFAINTDDPQAKFYYSNYLLDKNSEDYNEELAFSLLQEASKAEFSPAYSKIAYLYQHGEKRNLALAEKFYQRAYYAKQDSLNAESLAKLYNDKQSEKLYDYKKAITWYFISYELGNKSALGTIKTILLESNSKAESRKNDFEEAKNKAEKILKEIVNK